MRNSSSDSFDLLIINITETDEGLYYCGTDQFKVEQNEQITPTDIYTYGNISTRIHVSEYAVLTNRFILIDSIKKKLHLQN